MRKSGLKNVPRFVWVNISKVPAQGFSWGRAFESPTAKRIANTDNTDFNFIFRLDGFTGTKTRLEDCESLEKEKLLF
jgi:hypothetical protein